MTVTRSFFDIQFELDEHRPRVCSVALIVLMIIYYQTSSTRSHFNLEPAVSFSRNTRQRDAVRQAFEQSDRPLSPEEVLTLASEFAPGLGIATVYRNLKGLLAEDWLAPVALVGDAPRYERSGKHHHHHFHCSRCDKVYELEGCPEGINRLVPRGFKVEAHHLVLNGTCRSCVRP